MIMKIIKIQKIITVIIAIMITLKTFVMIIVMKVMVTVMLYLFKLLLFCNFLFLFKIIYAWKTYFTNKKEKKKFLSPILPVPLVTENQLLLSTVLTRPTPTLLPPLIQRLIQVKYQIVLVFKTFLTCCHFLLYIMFFFSLFIEISSSIFLTFVIFNSN